MSIVALLLAIGSLLASFFICKYSYKLYKEALIEDEIARQKEIEKQAKRVNTFTNTRTNNLGEDEDTIRDFINKTRKKRTTKE